MEELKIVRTDPGLCARCVHGRVIENRRGSRFHLCRRSMSDASFPRYPRLPVRRCDGYDAAGTAGGPGSTAAPPVFRIERPSRTPGEAKP